MGVNSQTTASSIIDPADWVEYAAREHPHRLFLRTPAGRQLSYEALREQSARLASALMRRGVARGVGDVVLPAQHDDVHAVGVHLFEETRMEHVGQGFVGSLVR